MASLRLLFNAKSLLRTCQSLRNIALPDNVQSYHREERVQICYSRNNHSNKSISSDDKETTTQRHGNSDKFVQPHLELRGGANNKDAVQKQSHQYRVKTTDQMIGQFDSSTVVVAGRSDKIRSDDDNAQLTVFIGDSFIHMKTVELYGLIRNMQHAEIIALVTCSYKSLNATHLALCLKTLHSLAQHQPITSQRKFVKTIQTDASFPYLCAAVTSRAKSLEPSVSADMLEYLAYFGVDSNDRSMQVMLSLAGYFINDLCMDQLITVADSVSHLAPTNQTRLLMDAIVTLCRLRCSDPSSVIRTLSEWHKITMLRVFGDRLPLANDLLRSLWGRRYDMNDDVTFNVMILDAFFHTTARHDALIDWCLNRIIEDFKSLSTEDVKLVSSACEHLTLYDPVLFSYLGQHAIDCHDIKTQFSISCLLAQCGYLHERLTNDVVRRLEQDSTCVLSFYSAQSAMDVIRLIANRQHEDSQNTDNKTAGCPLILWKQVEKWVADSMIEIKTTLSYDDRLDLCLFLKAFGCLDNLDLFKSLLANDAATVDSQAARESEKRTSSAMFSRSDKLRLLILYAGVFHTDSKQSSVLESALKSVHSDLDDVRQVSRDALPLTPVFRRLGFVSVDNVYAKASGLYINHVIGSHASECQHRDSRIAVLYWPGHYFWTNTRQLKCLPKLYARAIQNEGYKILVINSRQWETTREREKLDLLKYKINNIDRLQDLVMW